MIKKLIKYVDPMTGKSCKLEAYFHLNKLEIIELIGREGDMESEIKKFIDKKDMTGALNMIKRIISVGYGLKSEDGTKFIKTPEATADFESSEAFAELFMELFENEASVEEFFKGVAPKTGVSAPVKLKAKASVKKK